MKLSMMAFTAGIMLLSNILNAESIKLNDGSIINGTVSTLVDGIYTIKTNNLGQLKIPKSQIVSISQQEQTISASNINANIIESLQKTIMQDPQLMQQINELQKNPKVQEMLTDKVIMEAITSGNYNVLITNPKVQQLMNEPEAKAIIDKVK